VGESDRAILKLAIENSNDSVKHRLIAPTVIEEFQSKIDQNKDKIKETIENENIDKELTFAEMKVTRAQNLLEHEDEIKSRPKRTFMSKKPTKQKDKKRPAENELAAKNKRIQIKAAKNAKTKAKPKKLTRMPKPSPKG
jgi:ATP-dependent RNA helicase DDX27